MIQIHQDDKTNMLECSIKSFSDDLELALSKFFPNNKIDLKKGVPPELFKKYLDSHLRIHAGSKYLESNFIGGELKNESFWIYAEFAKSKKNCTIDLTCNWFYNVFPKQTNIFETDFGGKKHFDRLQYPDSTLHF